MKRLAIVLLFACNTFAAAPFLLRPELPLSEPEYGLLPSGHSNPHIATNGSDYLVVWTDSRGGGEPAVWAARMRPDGTLLDPTGIRVAASGQAGGVVWTGSHYLIAYDVPLGPITYVRSMTVDGVFGEPVEVARDTVHFGGMAMGAIATGGVRVTNEEVVRQLRIPADEIEAAAAREARELERRERAYRGGRPAPDLRGRTVILVDDGLATGSTMRAAARALRALGPARVVVAVPVGAPQTCEEFRAEVDEVVCAMTPEPFRGVGQWYDDFAQTSDSEVHDLLGRSAPERARAASGT